MTDKNKEKLFALLKTEDDDSTGRTSAIKQFIMLYPEFSYEEVEQFINENVGTKVKINDGEGTNILKNIDENRKHTLFDRYIDKLKTKQTMTNYDIEKLAYDIKRIMHEIDVVEEVPEFLIKGLVIGDIQSGKTANFSGLMSLAYDYGYHSVIVLSGMVNDLRDQTSNRLNDDFGILPDDIDQDLMGEFLLWDTAINNLTNGKDFSKNEWANYRSHIVKPHFFVVKKNASILANVINFFKTELQKTPRLNTKKFLIIDDEADQASLDNSPKNNAHVSKINALICELLSLFKKVSYVGYTATPFGNILADRKINSSNLNLFPNDFVYLLKTSKNYTGYDSFISEYSDLSSQIIRYIPYYEIDILDELLKGNVDLDIIETELNSFYWAINSFIVSSAIIEVQEERGNIVNKLTEKSMLINISAKTFAQSTMSKLIENYLLKLKKWNENEIHNEMKKCFDFEFDCEELSYEDIRPKIINILHQIQCYELNTSDKGKRINLITELVRDQIKKNDYAYSIYIGGHKLSRGLTISGLLVSYFYRNSSFYDAAMQMCRWFGYRGEYIQYTKLFTTDEIINNFINYFDSFELFKHFLSQNLEMGLSAQEIIYQIQYHEKTKPTSRNKMKGAEIAKSYFDNRSQIYDYFYDHKINYKNYTLVDNFLKKYKPDFVSRYFTLYKNISSSEIIKFCKELQLPNLSKKKIDYITSKLELINEENFKNWKIVIPNITKKTAGQVTLGNYDYNLSTKKYERILYNEQTKEKYYKLKVILNSNIEHFEEIKELVLNNEPVTTYLKGKQLVKGDNPVLFIFNAVLGTKNDDKNMSKPLNLYAFMLPQLGHNSKESIDFEPYWVNTSILE
ncbi:putative endonuclease [Spiroplasma eriocheiris CCTCC M 207170]|nr:putative endonuclease [Spiroplasma eriocheiris CCTCC M 207170]